jgi:hypothetical protein
LEHPVLGQTIYYIGMFHPLNRPMARSGTIGAIFQSGIPHSKGRYTFNAHLVDCRSYQGFSGSPCFAEVPILHSDLPPPDGSSDDRVLAIGYLALLCGMFTSHFSDEGSAEAGGVVSRYGVGVMLPSSLIQQALQTDDMREERLMADKKKQAEAEAATPPLQDAGMHSDDDPSSRFEDLTRKLVQVPKKELDELRKDE